MFFPEVHVYQFQQSSFTDCTGGTFCAILFKSTYQQSVSSWTLSGYDPSSLASHQALPSYQGPPSPATHQRTWLSLFECNFMDWVNSAKSGTDCSSGSWDKPDIGLHTLQTCCFGTLPTQLTGYVCCN